MTKFLDKVHSSDDDWMVVEREVFDPVATAEKRAERKDRLSSTKGRGRGKGTGKGKGNGKEKMKSRGRQLRRASTTTVMGWRTLMKPTTCPAMA